MNAETIQSLVVAATSLLQPYLPIIASKVAEKVGEEIPSTVNYLWEVIRKHFSRKPSAQETLTDLLKNPDDSDLQAAFRVQFKKLIEEDDEFAKIIKEIAGNREEQPRYFSSQNGAGNISIQGKDNIFTQYQSGGITANNVVVNNISTNPTPVLQINEIFINQPLGDKFHSKFKLSLLTPYPVGNLYIGVRAPKIESMEIVPMRAGAFMSGHAGKRDGYVFDNLHNAYGNYELRIVTEKPEKFVIEYNIE